MEKVIIDTSIFTNSASSSQFWDSKSRSARSGPPDPLEALINFLKLAQRTPNVKYLITPGVYKELFVYKGGSDKTAFIDESKVPKNLLVTLSHASPDPSVAGPTRQLFVDLIQENRKREHECELMIVERMGEIIEALTTEFPQQKKMNAEQKARMKRVKEIRASVATSTAIEQRKACGVLIRNMRESHRDHMRVGMVDSAADMDTIFLSQETNGYLAASDEGIIRWGEKFGCRTIPFIQLRAWMEARVTK